MHQGPELRPTGHCAEREIGADLLVFGCLSRFVGRPGIAEALVFGVEVLGVGPSADGAETPASVRPDGGAFEDGQFEDTGATWRYIVGPSDERFLGRARHAHRNGVSGPREGGVEFGAHIGISGRHHFSSREQIRVDHAVGSPEQHMGQAGRVAS